MNIQYMAAFVYVVMSGAGLAASPAPVPFDERLASVRSDLRVRDGMLGGPGAAILGKAIDNARYVLIGEDHLSREIPAFTTGICKLMAPKGLAAMAVEVGPEAATMVNGLVRRPDREARMDGFMAAHPDALAFLNGRDEIEMAGACAQIAGPTFRIWGLDQEFLGAGTYLIEQMAAAKPGPAARNAIAKLASLDRTAAAAAVASGDPGKFLILAIGDADMEDARVGITRDGGRRARELFDALAETRAIYLSGGSGTGDSNGRRARLMKRTLVGNLHGLNADARVLFKFGDVHIFKGINPLRQRDLGNFVAERAEGEGATSLHVLVLGAKGVHALYAGAGKQVRHEDFVMAADPDYTWITDVLVAEGKAKPIGAWSVFDLRELRAGSMKGVGDQWLKLIQGFDLLVLAPELTPSSVVGVK